MWTGLEMIDTAAFLYISITTIVRAVHSSESDLHYDHVRVQKLIKILNELDLVFCAAPYRRVHYSAVLVRGIHRGHLGEMSV